MQERASVCLTSGYSDLAIAASNVAPPGECERDETTIFLDVALATFPCPLVAGGSKPPPNAIFLGPPRVLFIYLFAKPRKTSNKTKTTQTGRISV